MITGFPGETDEQFDELVEFAKGQRFERLGVFTYSVEPGTPAVELPNHVDESVKEQRRDALMQVQQQVAFDWNAQQIGTTQDMMLDTPIEGQPNVFIARTIADAPDVDGIAYVTGDESHRAGQIVKCEVITSQGYDLVAAAIEPGR